jgi:hypothetical protein
VPMVVSRRAPRWTDDSGSELEREKVMVSSNSGKLAMIMEKKITCGHGEARWNSGACSRQRLVLGAKEFGGTVCMCM